EIDLAVEQGKDRPAVVKANDAVGLPSANKSVEDRIHIMAKMPAAANRQFVNITELEHVRNVKDRFRALQAQMIGVLHGENRAGVQEATAKEYHAIVGGRGVVNRLREGIGGQELQTVRKLLFGAKLQRVVDGVSSWWRVTLEIGVLRVRQKELE